MPENCKTSNIISPSLAMARSLVVSPDALQAMSPMELFQSQLSSDATEAKVDAMKRLHLVGHAMGAEAVLGELLPFLQEWLTLEPQHEHEDEILLILSQQLQRLVPSLLTREDQVMPLWPLLERLAAVEETVVREGAVISMNHMVSHLMDSGHYGNTTSTLVAMATRLVGADWFTAKVSACGMLPMMYKATKRSEVRQLYRELCADETPMVRRAAAKHLGEIMEYASEEEMLAEWMPVFVSLSKDEQDSVRLLAVSNAASVAKVLQKNPMKSAELVVPVIKSGCTDLSWRVRHNLAKEFGKVVTPLILDGNSDGNASKNIVAACYASLLQDMEAEVRAAAVPHLAPMTTWGGPQIYQLHLATLLPSLADDMVMEVRSKLALSLMECCEPSVPLEDTVVLNNIVPLLEGFLHDEFPEVQLHVLSNIYKLSHLLSEMNGVVTILLQMVKAGNWRVREAVGQALPHLLQAKGVEFFEQVLLEAAWLPLLLDPVSEVRAACVDGMSMLVTVAGAHWVQTEVLPHHARIYDSANNSYLTRITILQSYFATLSSGKKAESTTPPPNIDGLLQEVLFFLLHKGLKDKVANVRMVSARGLANMAALSLENGAMSQIRPAVEEALRTEEDDDCQYTYQLALDACG
mmetsp:Transcript_33301/g.50991  ORF Transcript_33301/g.50991 Transcript_33301/m.50991 type:complete len:636 (-) Transcript_33301:256-2163(-)